MYISKMKSHLHQFSPRHPRGLNLRCPGKVLSVSLPVCEYRARLLKYLAGCKSGKKICFSETVFYGFIEMIARRQPWCTADENTRDFLSNTQACLLANFDWIFVARGDAFFLQSPHDLSRILSRKEEKKICIPQTSYIIMA